MPKQKKPTQVRIAIALFYLALALGLAKPFIDNPFVGRPPGVIILISAVTAILTVLLIEFVSIGRNWARIVYLVLTLLGLPFSLIYLHQHLSSSLLAAASVAVQLVAHGAGLWLVFVGPGTYWFKRADAQT